MIDTVTFTLSAMLNSDRNMLRKEQKNILMQIFQNALDVKVGQKDYRDIKREEIGMYDTVSLISRLQAYRGHDAECHSSSKV